MPEKPRVGLILLRSELRGCLNVEELPAGMDADTQTLTTRLQKRFTVSGPWVVDSDESLAACQQELRSAVLDFVLLAFQTWAQDAQIGALIEAVGTRPLVLWAYLPWGRIQRPIPFNEVLRSSGPVGAIGALGTLRNLDVPFLFTWGAADDPRLVQDLEVAGRAAQVRNSLRSTRFGLLPSAKTNTQSIFVDEERMRSDFGPEVVVIDVDEYRRVLRELPQEAVDDYLRALNGLLQVDQVPPETLERAARSALGLAALAEQQRLDLLAIDDDSDALYQAAGLRPGLYPTLRLWSGNPREEETAALAEKVLYQPEADLGAALANTILHRLTGSPTMFLEFWFWDEALNQMIGGHGGVQNPRVADPAEVWISRDYERCVYEEAEGAQVQMIARAGRVTIFQLRCTPSGWQAIAASGVSIESRPIVEGFPHAIVRLDTPIARFLNSLAEVGAAQHWIMAYGSVLNELEAFCQMERIPLEILRY